MLRLSMKGRYAARLMLELAGCQGTNALQLKKIGESEEYLEYIVPRYLARNK